MKQHLFTLMFFKGVVPLVLSVPRMYYLIQEGQMWNDAQAYCQATHTGLAIIKSNDDMIQLQNAAQSQQFTSSAWVGLYNDINSWRWSMGNEPLGSTVQWDSGEPNNNGGDQLCAIIDPWGWNDRPCLGEYPFVCLDDTKTGTDRYIYIPDLLTWSDAQAYCRTHYTDLASDRDAAEHSAIQALVSDYTWIGLFRDAWKWIDQTNFSTISWMPGLPDNALGDQNCGYLNNGEAVDAQCSDIMPYFCYSEFSDVINPVIQGPRHTQIVRLKVCSNVDVNYPAVKAAILFQIEQKLKDHGVAQSRVSWRDQPDGMVFHKEKKNTIMY